MRAARRDFKIRAAENLGAAALTAREDVAEHLAEDVAEGLAGRESAAAPALETGVAELIVDGALAGIRKHLVGLLALLESVLGLRVVGIAVGMKFHRQASIRLLDIRLAGIPR